MSTRLRWSKRDIQNKTGTSKLTFYLGISTFFLGGKFHILSRHFGLKSRRLDVAFLCLMSHLDHHSLVVIAHLGPSPMHTLLK